MARRSLGARRLELADAVANGDAEAQFRLGAMHASGKGGPVIFVEARRLFELAVAQGYADAQYNLARLFKQGEKNVEQEVGAEWLLKAAEQIHSRPRRYLRTKEVQWHALRGLICARHRGLETSMIIKCVCQIISNNTVRFL